MMEVSEIAQVYPCKSGVDHTLFRLLPLLMCGHLSPNPSTKSGQLQVDLNTKIIASVMATLLLSWSASAAALTPLEELGKNIFFDEISIPGNKQACASCHDAARGGVLPNSFINNTTVVAPGAAPHALGSIKTPTNLYAFFSPPFNFNPVNPFVPPWEGGNFWDGRAEGCGATLGPCPTGDGAVSETITLADLPLSKQADYEKYLGPTADQALNPFPNAVEQNIREKNVCQRVKTAKYKDLYKQAFGEAIDCSPNPKHDPAYKTSYKRLAVALAAYQASSEVNSFSSKRDQALQRELDGKFPLVDFTEQENQGHDLFYGKAFCSVCHNGVPQGQPPDFTGEAPQQLYTDNRYHHIGVPFNREIPGVAKGEKKGLIAHVTPDHPDNVRPPQPGEFKTPTLRNVAKGLTENFIKAYTHNGWFKSLESLVHFYNTRDVLVKCEALGIANATEKEALQNNCWPEPEFPNPASFIIGNLGLTPEEEDAIVAYLKTLTDKHTPMKPR